jgi:hypothetical protein
VHHVATTTGPITWHGVSKKQSKFGLYSLFFFSQGFASDKWLLQLIGDPINQNPLYTFLTPRMSLMPSHLSSHPSDWFPILYVWQNYVCISFLQLWIDETTVITLDSSSENTELICFWSQYIRSFKYKIIKHPDRLPATRYWSKGHLGIVCNPSQTECLINYWMDVSLSLWCGREDMLLVLHHFMLQFSDSISLP